MRDSGIVECTGKWPEIMTCLGIDVGNGKHKPCPMCGGEKPFRFDDKGGDGTWICTHCGSGNGFELIKRVMNVDFKGSLDAVKKVLGSCSGCNTPKKSTTFNASKSIKALLKNSTRICAGDTVCNYLSSRGLSVFPNELRMSENCWESETSTCHPAMLGIFRDIDGKGITVHRTYLTATGKKLAIKSPKKIMPPIRAMAGGAVQLFPFVEGELGICEGIETGIAAREIFGIPVWAALSATLLKQFEPPEKVSELHIFGDSDKNFTGQAAAFALANRLAVKGVDVLPHIPDRHGSDFLDVLNEMRSK